MILPGTINTAKPTRVGFANAPGDGRMSSVIAEFNKAIEIWPNFAWVWHA